MGENVLLYLLIIICRNIDMAVISYQKRKAIVNAYHTQKIIHKLKLLISYAIEKEK